MPDDPSDVADGAEYQARVKQAVDRLIAQARAEGWDEKRIEAAVATRISSMSAQKAWTGRVADYSGGEPTERTAPRLTIVKAPPEEEPDPEPDGSG